MKKFKILGIMALAALAPVFGACSSGDDTIVRVPAGSGEISFAANTDFTRSGDITTNNLTSFNVYAYTSSNDSLDLFMNNVTVSKTSANVWTYSPVRYWPADKSVDFYAFAPAGWVDSGGPLKPVAYDAYPGKQDIVYAVNEGLRGAVGQPNPQVIFNFRHALSKITLKMSSSNQALTVRVTNVALSNIRTKGNFSFPDESTSGDPTQGSVGKWSDQNTPSAYILHMSQTPAERLVLNATPTVIAPDGAGMGGTLFMMPQPLTWRSHGAGEDNYIAIMCAIYDAKSDVKLWPNDNTPEENRLPGSTFGDGILKFPLSSTKFSEWSPGCHYIYNIVINSNEEMGAIEFGNPTVDTFIDVETTYE